MNFSRRRGFTRWRSATAAPRLPQLASHQPKMDVIAMTN